MSSKILSIQEPERWRRRSRSGGPGNNKTSPSGKEFRGGIDRALVGIVLSLCGFGLMAVYSASAPEAQQSFQDSTAMLRKQTISFVIGLFVMFTVSRYNYRSLKKFAWPLVIAAIGMLGLTLIPSLSVTTWGSSRWIQLGPIQFQPSEICKIATIILLSSGFSKYFWWSKQILLRICVVLAMALVIVKQPDLGSASMIIASLLALVWASGMNAVLIFGTMGVGLSVIWRHVQKTPYQMARIETWLNPYLHPQKEGWNIIQAQLAIGSGGWWGQGFGRSLQKLYYLPVQHADFIFAVIAEEFGLIGCCLVISLFALFGYHGFRTALAAKTLFGRFLAIGITSEICTQAVVNMMVTTGVTPVTGITLPFISYGGTSLVITLAMVGILLSVSRDRGPSEDDEYEDDDQGDNVREKRQGAAPTKGSDVSFKPVLMD